MGERRATIEGQGAGRIVVASAGAPFRGGVDIGGTSTDDMTGAARIAEGGAIAGEGGAEVFASERCARSLEEPFRSYRFG